MNRFVITDINSIVVKDKDGKLVDFIARKKTKNYSQDQKRDGKGRFAPGGSAQSNMTVSEALYWYQDYGYQAINTYLNVEAAKKRGEKVTEYTQKDYENIINNKELKAKVDDSINKIDTEMNSQPVKPVYVYRTDDVLSSSLFESTGVGKQIKDKKLEFSNHEDYFNNQKEVDDTISQLKGKTFTYDGYVSTSQTKEGAQQFGDGGSISQYGMQSIITISGYTKSLDVNKYTGSDSYGSMENTEKELLLPRNTEIKIDNIKVNLTSREGYSGPRGEQFQLEIKASIVEKTKNYSPKQSRGSDGRWIPGSGSIDLTNMSNPERIEYLTKTLSADYNDEELSAMNDYTDMSWAGAINRYYRNGDSANLEGYTVKQITDKAEIISNASVKSKLPKAMTLYRVTNNIPDTLSVGDIYVDKGLGSTSAISGLFKQEDIKQLKIYAKKGQPIINMSIPHMKYRGKVDNQAEIILPLDTSYKVISINSDKIELEVL